jgi:hypothetical protein
VHTVDFETSIGVAVAVIVIHASHGSLLDGVESIASSEAGSNKLLLPVDVPGERRSYAWILR